MRPSIGQTKRGSFTLEEQSAPRGERIVVQTQTAAAGVVEHLRERILSGSLQPGMSLPPERELAGQLEVSRATLREGLSTLSHMGLLRIQPGRSGGAVVTLPLPTTVSASIALLFQTRAITAGQLSEFRRALEVEAAQLAAARRTDRDLEEIAVALNAYAGADQDARAQNAHGWAFHHAVARASKNPLLAETMSSLNDAFAECFELLHATADPASLILELHEPILDAIRARDMGAARQTMLLHFDQLQQVLHSRGLSERPIGTQSATAPALAEATGLAHRASASLVGRG